jgi:small-conductance mechanosensitive channel
VFQLLILIALGLLLRGLRFRSAPGAAEDTPPAIGISLGDRPFSLALLLTLLATPWLYVSVPPAMGDLVGLLLIIPVLRLVLPLIDAHMQPPLLGLGALYVLDKVRDLLETAPVVARLLFIVEMIAAIAVVAWFLRSTRKFGAVRPQPVNRWRAGANRALGIALLVVSVAALATAAGFVRLGVLIGSGALNSAYLAVFLVAVVRVSDALLTLVLRSRIAQTLRAIRDRSDTILRRSTAVLRIVAVAAWALATLDQFALLDPVQSGLRVALLAKLEAGAISLSLADVLAFMATLAAAFLLARLITTLLDEDVYSRTRVSRGAAYAISTVVRYAILLLGFFVAVGAMGLGMDRITVLLGAFGVGLGFGLQNIVNNFVSGLILIFERPVQVGDAVEVGSVKGKVKRIGIRSSTVRTFDGADVTLPNGNLLSEALTNWTQSDRVRRLEIAVGVAYGTDPDAVIEVLREAESRQEGLVEDPAPQVLFRGFGESSLDFVLRAWVEDNDQWAAIQSDLALAVNRGMKERDIEIPFPQRDLHLRSIAPELRQPSSSGEGVVEDERA